MPSAMITGASRRLGLYLVEKLLAQGWQVYALTRQASPELKALSSNQNLTIYEHENYTFSCLEKLAGPLNNLASLDVLINNASIYEADNKGENNSGEFYQNLFFIHMQMPAWLAEKLTGALTTARGNIISITDIYADNPKADSSLYCSTKAGLQNLSLGLAKKLAPLVRVNCIQPGPIKFLDEHSDTHKQQVLAETLVAEEGGFEPVFKTVQFILDNHYLTGGCIKVDGGRSLMRG